MHSSQNKTGVTDVFPSLMRSCQDFLASNYSTSWPIYGLNNNWMDFTIDRLNPYATPPPQVIRTIPISHQLPLTPQNQLHRCVPFVDAVTDMLCVVVFSIFMVLLPEGGMSRFYLEPARRWLRVADHVTPSSNLAFTVWRARFSHDACLSVPSLRTSVVVVHRLPKQKATYQFFHSFIEPL